jgi:hypothetical protein
VTVPSPDPDWLDQVERKQARQDKLFAPDHEVALHAYRRRCLAVLRSLLADPELRLRCPQDAFEAFLQEERWRTKLLLSGVNSVYRQRRIAVEAKVLGVPTTCAPVDRPYYAYVRGSDERRQKLLSYGSVVLHLEPAVREKASVCCGDSFATTAGGDGPVTAASPLLDPQLQCRQAETDIFEAATVREAADPRDGYVETQIHTRFAPGHIDFVSFTEDTRPSEALISLMSRHEIDYVLVGEISM